MQNMHAEPRTESGLAQPRESPLPRNADAPPPAREPVAVTGRWRPSPSRGRLSRRPHRDDGMSTAEYAIGTLAAVAFAGVLLKVVTSDKVRDLLTSIIERALR